MEIFCPNNHLVLADNTCSKCGWIRSPHSQVGSYHWGPIDLLAGFGGTSIDKLNTFTVIGQTLLFILRSNEIVGVSVEKGQVLGRTALPRGQVIKSVTKANGKAIVTVQDAGSLMDKPIGASLKEIDFKTTGLEDVFRSESHDISAPLFIDGKIILRESLGRLIAIDHETKAIIWEQALEGWHSYPLLAVNESVLLIDGNSATGSITIKAFDIKSGHLRWAKEIQNPPMYPMVGNDETVYINQRKTSLQAISSKTGELRWEFSARRIYTSPVIYGTEIILSIKCAEQGYQIISLSNETGELTKQIPMESSVRYMPILFNNMLYVIDGKGYLAAYDWGSGQLIWKKHVVLEPDVFDAVPKLIGDFIVLGTYLGKLVAIAVNDPAEKTQSAEELLEKKDFESAAKVFALSGEFAEAATIYLEELKDENRALQLLEYGGFYDEAAEIAFKKAFYSQALDFFRKADNNLGKARTYEAMGDQDRAAQLYEAFGDRMKAADLYEKVGKTQQALQIYIELNCFDDYKRLISQVSFDETYGEQLHQIGDFETAAKWAFDNRQYLNASRDYRQIGKQQSELLALKLHLEQLLANNQPVNLAVWQRLAELGEVLEDYAIAGQGWAELDRPEPAGEAFYRHATYLASHANEDINTIPENERENIAHYYQLAADSFSEAGQGERQSECENHVRRFLQLPLIIIMIAKTSEGFRELEWNELFLTVKNIGYGRAIDIDFSVDSSRFEVESAEKVALFNLAAGRSIVRKLFLKPFEGATGRFVPLKIQWTYYDHHKKAYSEDVSQPVGVAKALEETSMKPVNYHFHNIDTLVTGTVSTLDKSSGDRVEINRQSDNLQAFQVKSGDDVVSIGTNPLSKGMISLSDVCPHCGGLKSPIEERCEYCSNSQTDFDEDQRN